MTNKRQQIKHYSKVAHKTKEGAYIAVRRLEKQGILTRAYKKYGKWYLTERYRGAKVLSILEGLKKDNN